MEIVKVYKTSKGFFLTLEEAKLKKNCPKDTDPRGLMRREIPSEVFAIYSDGDYFELNKIQVS